MLFYYVLPIAAGVAAGFLSGLYGMLVAAAAMFLLPMLVVANLEVPAWGIGLAMAGLAGLGGLVGTFLGAVRRRHLG